MYYKRDEHEHWTVIGNAEDGTPEMYGVWRGKRTAENMKTKIAADYYGRLTMGLAERLIDFRVVSLHEYIQLLMNENRKVVKASW